MLQNDNVSYQVFAVSEFIDQAENIGKVTLTQDKWRMLAPFIERLKTGRNEFFEQIEALAQLPNTSELTIFLSDFLERLDYTEPFDFVANYDSLCSDFITLADLLLDEDESRQAMHNFAARSKIAAGETASEEKETAAVHSSTETDIETIALPVPLVHDGLDKKEYTLTELVFIELGLQIKQNKAAAADAELASALEQYLLQLQKNYQRKPELILHQPAKEAVLLGQELIALLNGPEIFQQNKYFVALKRLGSALWSYGEKYRDDLMLSFSGAITASGEGEADAERKVLQKRIYSYFEKESEHHISVMEAALRDDQFGQFWLELEALRTLVMIHGYEGTENACLRLIREQEQFADADVDTFLRDNKHDISAYFKAILVNEREGNKDEVANKLAILDEIVLAGFARFVPAEIESEDFPEYIDIVATVMQERALDTLPEWIPIDRDNAQILSYTDEFVDGIEVANAYFSNNEFLPWAWQEFYSAWPEIFRTQNVEQLSERVNYALELSAGTILSLDRQDLIVPEIFAQLRQRFSDLAPYYQLTDDEQAYFQEQVSSLAEFIESKEYHDYITKLLKHLNEHFFEEYSDQWVRKYFERLQQDYATMSFPLDDIFIPKPESEQVSDAKVDAEAVLAVDDAAVGKGESSGWIEELEKAVDAPEGADFIDVFRHEAATALTEVDAHLAAVTASDIDLGLLENQFHSMQAAAELVGLQNYADLCRQLEDVFIHMRANSTWKKHYRKETFTGIIAEMRAIAAAEAEDSELSSEALVLQLRNTLQLGEFEDKAAPPEISDEPVDAELLAVFEQETGSNIEQMKDSLQRLQDLPGNQAALQELNNASHSVLTAARMLGFAAIGDLMEKVEEAIEKVLAQKTKFSMQQVEIMRGVVSATERFLANRESAATLTALAGNLQARLQGQSSGDLSLSEYYHNYFFSDVEKALRQDVDEIRLRAYTANLLTFLSEDGGRRDVRLLLDKPFAEWLATVRNLQSKAPEGSTKITPIAAAKTDLLLASSAAMVDSQMGMHEQLRDSQVLLTEMNTTQNLLNYVRSEMQSLDEKGVENKSTRRRRKELSGIFDAAVSKMNHLVEQMGQLNQTFADRVSDFGSMSTSFQRNILAARKVTAVELLRDLSAFVADLAGQLNKDVRVEGSGAEITLDVSTLAFLRGHLQELLTNALVHGIETAAERQERQKDAVATLRIEFRRRRNLIEIEVEDDGRGLDADVIADRAREMGIAVDESDDSIVDILFAEGFSTRSEVDSHSGDGNGLAQLKQAVKTMRGDISLDAETDAFTRFTIAFPEHSKIAEAAIVRIANDTFALPIGEEDELITIGKEDIHFSDDQYWVQYQKRRFPALFLDQEVHPESVFTPARRQAALRFIIDEQYFFLLTSEVKAMQTIVIRPLQRQLEQMDYIAGVAQLPDFQTILVLQTDVIIKQFEKLALPADPQDTDADTSEEKSSNDFRHAVILDPSTVSTRLLANYLRENDIETEVVNDVNDWREDFDKADVLFVTPDFLRTLRSRKGLWIDAPTNIVLLSDDPEPQVSGTDAVLVKPFNQDEVKTLLREMI
jgi:two-component system chemotaxis sensor kinase CheA